MKTKHLPTPTSTVLHYLAFHHSSHTSKIHHNTFLHIHVLTIGVTFFSSHTSVTSCLLQSWSFSFLHFNSHIHWMHGRSLWWNERWSLDQEHINQSHQHVHNPNRKAKHSTALHIQRPHRVWFGLGFFITSLGVRLRLLLVYFRSLVQHQRGVWVLWKRESKQIASWSLVLSSFFPSYKLAIRGWCRLFLLEREWYGLARRIKRSPTLVYGVLTFRWWAEVSMHRCLFGLSIVRYGWFGAWLFDDGFDGRGSRSVTPLRVGTAGRAMA